MVVAAVLTRNPSGRLVGLQAAAVISPRPMTERTTATTCTRPRPMTGRTRPRGRDDKGIPAPAACRARKLSEFCQKIAIEGKYRPFAARFLPRRPSPWKQLNPAFKRNPCSGQGSIILRILVAPRMPRFFPPIPISWQFSTLRAAHHPATFAFRQSSANQPLKLSIPADTGAYPTLATHSDS